MARFDIPDIAVGDENAAARQELWEAELVERFEKGLPLTKADKREAKRILKARAAQ